MPTIRTVGELKKLLADMPDDLVIGGYDGRDNPDYKCVSVYRVNRATDEDIHDWPDEKVGQTLVEWWAPNPVPDEVLVFDVD